MIFGFLLLPKIDAKQIDYGISPINTKQDYDAAISRIAELPKSYTKSYEYTKSQRRAIYQPRVSALGIDDYTHLDFGGIVAFFSCNNADKISLM